MLRKRVTALLLAAMMLASLASCGEGEASGPAPENPRPYAARHTVLESYGILYDGYARASKVYYIGKPSARSTIQTVFTADLSTGENKSLEAFTQHQLQRMEGDSDWLHQIAAAPDGSLRILAERTVDQQTVYVLLYLDQDGNVTEELLLESDFSDRLLYNLPVIECDDNGNTYLLSGAGVTLPDGQSVRQIAGQFDRLVPLAEGMGVLSASPDKSQWTVWDIDVKQCALGESFSVKAPARLDNCRFCAGRGDYAFFCGADLSLYGFQRPEKTVVSQPEVILSWLNCDVEGPSLLAVAAAKEGGFCCITDGSAFGAEGALLRQQEEAEGPVRTVTLGCRELPPSLAQQILRFNRQNNGVRVEVMDYGASASGFAAAADRMTIDLISGKMPDLLCIAGMDRQALISQGLLEDLWPWIDSDKALGGREALVEPVFDALSQNGKLYELTGQFRISTAYALTELVGDTPGWTVEQFMQVYRNMEDCRSITNPFFSRREAALEDVLARNIQGFIDWENWSAGFDSPEFAALLEYVGLFPENAPKGAAEERELWPSEKKQLTVTRFLFRLFTDTIEPLEAFGTAPVTRIGFPGVAGNGSTFTLDATLSMCTACENKEDAWAVLRTLLLPENQGFDDPWKGYGDRYFPTNRSVYDAMVRRAMTQPENLAVTIWFPGGQSENLSPWTQEQADDFYGFLSGITVVEYTDEALSAIIRDEAARFFAGQQTAEAAAKAVQSRVNLYLGERK